MEFIRFVFIESVTVVVVVVVVDVVVVDIIELMQSYWANRAHWKVLHV